MTDKIKDNTSQTNLLLAELIAEVKKLNEMVERAFLNVRITNNGAVVVKIDQ